jgi:hypothetical protein
MNVDNNKIIVDNNKIIVDNKSNISNYVYPYDFDYNFYKSLYLNDKSYSKEEIIFDFTNNGYFNFKYGCMKEYCDYNYILSQNIEISDIIKKSNKEPELKVISNKWNIYYNTCIIIHGYSITIFKEIMNCINNTNLKTFCNLIIVSPTKDIITYIKNDMKDDNITLLYIKNRGMDTYGKLIAFKYILDNNLKFEWFLYLHTKTNSNWFNDLINPLLNKKVIDDINKNRIDKNVYMIGSEDCKTILKVSDKKYTSINLILNKAGYKVKIGATTPASTTSNNFNEIYAYWKLNIDLKYNINTYKEAYEHYQQHKNKEIRITLNDYINDNSNFKYVAGTMYWSRINLIHYYKNMLKFLLSTMHINNRIVYSEYDVSTIHLSELLDGILIQLNNKKILFVNDNDNNSDILNTNNFNYIFYKLNNPDIPCTNKNNLIEHYLKYGIHENRQASLNFYIYNCIYQNTNFNIFKNLDYVSNNYKYINYKNSNNYYYKSDKDIYCIKNVYTNLNTLIKHDVYKATNRKYILIITFSIGGGCSEFLNKLVNYYIFNKCVNIIIIKYESNRYTINYNNLLINKNFNFEMITKFINKINIKHILVNTFYTFPKNFKDFIYSLNIKKYTITHDYYNFFELPNPVYPHLKYKDLYKNEINNFDVILTQNIYNIDVMNYICPIKKEIHLIDFPDYCNNLSFINHGFNNSIRNILIIGAIDYKKGSLLINEIFNKYSNKYNFFIAGKHENKNINQQEYKSIHELNNILNLFKPCVILFTSLCPETYSYTLTLAMLTELPIIYYDIGECVVSKRLEEYKFDSYKLCDINNFGMIVDSIFINNKIEAPKLIDSQISVSTYWDNIFINNDDAFNNYNYENLILITSKIYVSNNRFSYIEKRSIYNKEERYVQTINTINSIKKYIPNVFIVLIDNSIFTENEKDVLINNTNIFINHNDKILDYYTNNSEIKAIAELCQIKYALNVINNYNIKFNNFFKITGRYIINNNFLYDIYAKIYKNDNIFKRNKLIKDRIYYYTCFYKISQNNFNDYVNKIYDLYSELVLKPYENIYYVIDLEFLLPSQLQFKEVNDLGITQYISCFNEISDI